MNIYRKIYETFYDKIPVDQDGRTYDIHHIDGDRTNNSILNLVALSIQDHYDVHYIQGDYGAAKILLLKMKKDKDEANKLNSLAQFERVNNRTHNFLGGGIQKKTQKRLLEKGFHNSQRKDIVEKVRNARLKEVAGGNHHFSSSEWHKKFATKNNKKRIENGTHNFIVGPPWNTMEWDIIFPDGHKETIFSLSKFCKENNLNIGHLHETSKENSRRKQHKGYSAKRPSK